MSLSSKVKKTVQDILNDLDDVGNRILLTIPFGCDKKDATGFVSVAGEKDSFPILTICVENPLTKNSTVSTIIFPKKEIYNSLIEKLLVDYSLNFEGDKNDQC